MRVRAENIERNAIALLEGVKLLTVLSRKESAALVKELVEANIADMNERPQYTYFDDRDDSVTLEEFPIHELGKIWFEFPLEGHAGDPKIPDDGYPCVFYTGLKCDPMVFRKIRYIRVCHGNICNFTELRRQTGIKGFRL